MSSFLSFPQTTYDWGGGNGFGRGGKWRNWGTIFPKHVKKVLISIQKEAYFSTRDLSQTFEKIFYQFAHSTTTFPGF